jgi:hypothetical protein
MDESATVGLLRAARGDERPVGRGGIALPAIHVAGSNVGGAVLRRMSSLKFSQSIKGNTPCERPASGAYPDVRTERICANAVR